MPSKSPRDLREGGATAVAVCEITSYEWPCDDAEVRSRRERSRKVRTWWVLERGPLTPRSD